MVSDTHRQKASGSKLPFYGVVRIPIKLKNVKLKEIFVVNQISKDAILGIAFFFKHNWRIDFTKLVVTTSKRETSVYKPVRTVVDQKSIHSQKKLQFPYNQSCPFL